MVVACARFITFLPKIFLKFLLTPRTGFYSICIRRGDKPNSLKLGESKNAIRS
ncbi:hypothetical protein [Escherichia phage vB_EcoM_ULIM9]|nr:hypothetical protein [Escherichia phage vB_EcoM_ULIM9]